MATKKPPIYCLCGKEIPKTKLRTKRFQEQFAFMLHYLSQALTDKQREDIIKQVYK